MRPEHDRAFTEFAATSIPQLRRMAFAWTHDWAAADDAVQAALEKMVRSWHRIDDRDPYFYSRTVLIRLLISEARKPWKHRERLSGLLYAAHVPAPSGEDDGSDILATLSLLSPMQRAVMVLRYVEDLTVQQTAHALRCSEGNVKKISYEARKRLGTSIQGGTSAESPRLANRSETSQQQ